MDLMVLLHCGIVMVRLCIAINRRPPYLPVMITLVACSQRIMGSLIDVG